MGKNTKSVITILLVLVATGCASQTMTNRERTVAYNQFISTEQPEQVQKITAFKFHGWTPLGEEHIIINSHYNRYVLLTFNNACDNLNFANTIKVNNVGTTIRAKIDSIYVSESKVTQCFIKSIHNLTKEQSDTIKNIGSNDFDKQA